MVRQVHHRTKEPNEEICEEGGNLLNIAAHQFRFADADGMTHSRCIIDVLMVVTLINVACICSPGS
jgi:hypothetical protein